MDGWSNLVYWLIRGLPPVLYKHRKSPSLSLFSLSWHHNYLQVQWISHTVAPVLLSSQRRNLIHASVEMIRRVFIKPTCSWLVGIVSDGLFVNCTLNNVIKALKLALWSSFVTLPVLFCTGSCAHCEVASYAGKSLRKAHHYFFLFQFFVNRYSKFQRF